jgi:hypothetical protein
MKKILVLMLMVITMAAYSQKNTLTTVNTVKPKSGQKMAFEAAYKQHVTKFHTSSSKINVYEILSGPYQGYYHLVESGQSYADFDTQRADANAHNLDLDKTFFPLLEETMNANYVWIDSLGIHPNATAESFVVTINHLKQGLDMGDYRRELSRAVKIRNGAKTPFWENFSASYYEQLWDGSDQITVNVRALKDGFKSLEQGYYPPAPKDYPLFSFHDEYAKLHGHGAWDERVKLLEDAVVKTEQYIMKLRKDLSSKN